VAKQFVDSRIADFTRAAVIGTIIRAPPTPDAYLALSTDHWMAAHSFCMLPYPLQVPLRDLI